MTIRSHESRRAGNGRGRLPTLRFLAAAATVLIALAWRRPACRAVGQTGGFPDVGERNVHAPSIDAPAADSRNILASTGCGEGGFRPGDPLPRWVMGVWLVQALDGKDPAPSSDLGIADVVSRILRLCTERGIG